MHADQNACCCNLVNNCNNISHAVMEMDSCTEISSHQIKILVYAYLYVYAYFLCECLFFKLNMLIAYARGKVQCKQLEQSVATRGSTHNAKCMINICCSCYHKCVYVCLWCA